MRDDIQAYSERTKTTYPNWAALVEAEANGYVVVAIISDGKRSWPYVIGPMPEDQAKRVHTGMRNKWRREQRDRLVDPKWTAKFFTRPAWKQPD